MKQTQADFINKAKIVHGDIYEYSLTNYENTHSKIKIICKNHGEFEQFPYTHLGGGGCSKCVIDKKTCSTADFINKAKLVHGDKYDYSLVNYENSRSKIKIICKIHGEFEQTPNKHLRGSGCIKCATIKRSGSTVEFIHKANLIHGDKYDYSLVDYKNRTSKVIIICSIHGEFEQMPYCHLKGYDCFACGIDKIRKSTDDFITKAKEVHGDTYDYSLVDYKNSLEKVKIICKIHGIFEQISANHLTGYKCSLCSNSKKGYNTSQWVIKAKEVHEDKYDYSKVDYANSRTKVIIICKKHGEFKQDPSHHIRGCGCPKCMLCPSCNLWSTRGCLCVYCKPKNDNNHYKKTKEYAVVNFLRENIIDVDFIHNKSVGTDCTEGHIFPDIRFDLTFFHLIIEIDEHKHRGADYSCDKQRMYDIIAKLGLPCVFIRYNPDNKHSDKNVLLAKINEYLSLTEDEKKWDDYGFKAEYLFY